MRWRFTSIIPCVQTYFRPSIICSVRPSYRVIFRTAVHLSFKVVGDTIMYPDEPPILIFHGLFESKKNWESIGKTIQNLTQRAVFAVDLRNHGDSPHVNSHKYKDMAEDIQDMLKNLGLEKVTLLGHSIGGRACMCAALMTPQLVSSLIVVDISPVSSCPQLLEYPKTLEAMKSIDFDKLPKKTVRKAKKYAEKQLIAAIKDHAVRGAIVSNIKVRRNGIIGWSCNLDVLIKQFKHIAWFPQSMKTKKYEGPTLFVGGQLSDFIPPDDLSAIRDIFPRSLVTYVKGAGHNVHLDDPRSFLEKVIYFIKNHHVKY